MVAVVPDAAPWRARSLDRKSTRLNSSHSSISYAVFCLKKKKKKQNTVIPNKKVRREILTFADYVETLIIELDRQATEEPSYHVTYKCIPAYVYNSLTDR